MAEGKICRRAIEMSEGQRDVRGPEMSEGKIYQRARYVGG